MYRLSCFDFDFFRFRSCRSWFHSPHSNTKYVPFFGISICQVFASHTYPSTLVHRQNNKTGIKYVKSNSKGDIDRNKIFLVILIVVCRIKWLVHVASSSFEMKRIILLVVLVLHSILLYTNYTGSGVTAVNASSKTKETNFFASSSRYFQFEKGNLQLHVHRRTFFIFLFSDFLSSPCVEADIFNDDEPSILKRSKGDRRGWVKI